MTGDLVYQKEEWLREQYIEKDLDRSEVADLADCSRGTIGNWLREFDIKKGARVADVRLKDESWLRDQYCDQQKTKDEISDVCDCHEDTVGRWLDRHGIEKKGIERLMVDEKFADESWLRQKHHDDEKSITEIANEFGCNPCTVINWLDKHGIEHIRYGYLEKKDQRIESEEWLEQKYVQEKLSSVEIAEICDKSVNYVLSSLERHGIEKRPRGVKGEKHWNWAGGAAEYGDGWNVQKRRQVRARDDFTCQDPRCSVTKAEHVEQYGTNLHVHHLKKARDVESDEERNAPENLITLCCSCHRRWEKISETGLVPEVSR